MRIFDLCDRRRRPVKPESEILGGIGFVRPGNRWISMEAVTPSFAPSNASAQQQQFAECVFVFLDERQKLCLVKDMIQHVDSPLARPISVPLPLTTRLQLQAVEAILQQQPVPSSSEQSRASSSACKTTTAASSTHCTSSPPPPRNNKECSALTWSRTNTCADRRST